MTQRTQIQNQLENLTKSNLRPKRIKPSGIKNKKRKAWYRTRDEYEKLKEFLKKLGIGRTNIRPTLKEELEKSSG